MNKSRFIIRNFRYPEDYLLVYSLWERAGAGIHVRRSDQAVEIEKKIQRDPDLFLVAEMNSEVIGTVLGGFDGRRGMVYHLAVAPEQRQNGIGSALMDTLEHRLREKGCLRVYLLVTKENRDAIQYYEQHGWSMMDDILLYAKDIN